MEGFQRENRMVDEKRGYRKVGPPGIILRGRTALSNRAPGVITEHSETAAASQAGSQSRLLFVAWIAVGTATDMN